MTNDDKDDPPEPEPSPSPLAGQLRFLRVEETGEETAKGPILVLKPIARVQATASAESIFALDLAFKPKPNLRADLESLAKQTDGRATETLNVIIEDSDSTCEQFEFNIGDLTQKQAKILLVQIVARRKVEEQQQRDLEKVALQSSLGFVGKLFAWLGRGG